MSCVYMYSIFFEKIKKFFYLLVASKLQNQLGLDFHKIRGYWLSVIFRSSLVQSFAEGLFYNFI